MSADYQPSGFNQILARRIKIARLWGDFSVSRAAKILNISPDTYRKYEHFASPNTMPPLTMKRFLDMTGISFESLMRLPDDTRLGRAHLNAYEAPLTSQELSNITELTEDEVLGLRTDIKLSECNELELRAFKAKFAAIAQHFGSPQKI